MPKISVITPCYNGEKYISLTLDSMLDQTFTDWEHVVVDDGSTDNSAQIIATYTKKDARIKLIQQPNGGAQNARNNGVKFCSLDSEYLLWLDSDDILAPNMFEVMIEYLEQHPQVGLVFCEQYWINSGGKIIKTFKTIRFIPSHFSITQLPYNQPETPFISIGFDCILEPMAVIRRSIYEQTTGWPEWLGQGGEGIDLFLQIALLSEIHFMPQYLYYYRRHPQQLTNSNYNSEIQMQKLVNKWKEGKDISDENRAKYAELAWWYENRYFPYLWVQRGRAMIRNGKYLAGLRLHWKALIPYIISLLSAKTGII